jgi:hypothetical protein
MRSPTPRRIAWVLAMLLVLAVSSGIYRSGPTAPLAALPVASAALAESDSSPLFVYVDPIYGDDAQAGVLNPTHGSPNPGPPQGALFDAHTDPTQVSGYLQHAPYSFKTLTAALAYIQQFNPNVSVRGPREARP